LYIIYIHISIYIYLYIYLQVYRHPWLHEAQRRPFEEELSLLANCYGKFTNYHHYQCAPGY
jgi:hypothetical protein